jgi:aminopeptidase N
MLIPLLLLAAAPSQQVDDERDPRSYYDVRRYDLALEVDPAEERIGGSVTVDALALEDQLKLIQLDLSGAMTVERVLQHEREVGFGHVGEALYVQILEPLERGARFSITVEYSGSPKAENAFDGFHWARTADGSPWINTSCQGSGSRSWWPGKDSYFHPEDKPDDGTRTTLTVPAGLYAVSNGRLAGIDDLADGRRAFRWVHPYPLETYSVTLNVAPYVVVESELAMADGTAVPWIYYVLPEDAEKAAVQFAQVPELFAIYSDAFGPWPFPKSKFALVETNFWGMEHSTAVAYGSSFPAWCQAHGERDRYANRNKDFDYILVHEVAHEWWGNAVSAAAWGHFWIHEGFGTYAEGVYVERTLGRERADAYFAGAGRGIGKTARLYRGDDVDSGEAYAGVIYSKGACVLNTLRHYVDDDAAWWNALRTFNLRFRYSNATSDDFRHAVEEAAGGDWKRFFDEWVYGEGQPHVTGTVRADGDAIAIDVEVGSTGTTTFHVPLDLSWTEGGEPRTARVWLEPGAGHVRVACGGAVSDVAVVHLQRVLGRHDVTVGD